MGSRARRLAVLKRSHLGAAIGGGVIAVILQSAWTPVVAFAKTHVVPFINGSVAYVNSTSGPVVEGDQQGSGIGVEGVTDTGAAAGAIALQGFGTSSVNASVGINGAVLGPGSTGLIGNANGTTGNASIGLEGFSKNGEGVFAQSTSPNYPSLRSLDGSGSFDVRLSDPYYNDAITAFANPSATPAAVVAVDDLTTAGASSGAIYADSSNGPYGIVGSAQANGAAGIYGNASGTSSYGVLGSGATWGVYGSSPITGVWGYGEYGVVGQCSGPNVDEFVGDNSSGTPNFTVNCSGTPSAIIPLGDGRHARVYESQSTSVTVEDYGQGELVGGRSHVALDSTYAAAISRSSAYLVFLTPDGDSRGLFVSSKTPTGFDVREQQGGRSTLAFDYRIIARRADASEPRMPIVSPSELRSIPTPSSGRRLIPRPRVRLANFYEPHFGADGKLHSTPLKYTLVPQTHP